MSKKEYKVTTNQWRAKFWGDKIASLSFFVLLWVIATSVAPSEDTGALVSIATAMLLYIAGTSISVSAVDKTWEEREDE